MLLSPEIMVSKTEGATLGRGVTLRLEDFLLVVIGFSWFAKNAIHKELGLFLKTPLNKPILFYLLACVISTGFGIMAGRTSPKIGFFFRHSDLWWWQRDADKFLSGGFNSLL